MKQYHSINNILQTTSNLTFADRIIHILCRLGLNRDRYKIDPGLYSLGQPTGDSPVFVTANYALSFDALRASLIGFDCYLLVLDTKGINVWCAAGKGTFGTAELVRRIEMTALKEVVAHRKLILPQLGAPGVAAHDIQKRTGFHVEYGPVRADDLPEFLKTHQATDAMRRVTFNLKNRLLLIPVEVVSIFLPLLIVTTLSYFLGGIWFALGVAAAMLAGVSLFPMLLPWIPTHNFSSKGFILGGIIALPFALAQFLIHSESSWWLIGTWAMTYMLLLPPITAFLGLNFTGATTFTSRSGVKKEIYKYIPFMAWTFGSGLVVFITLTITGI